VFAASHAPRSFLSFPRGVPLLASLEHSRPGRTLQSHPTLLSRPAALMGFTDTLRRFSPTKQAANAFPHRRAHVPFVRIQLAPDRFHRAESCDDFLLIGQRDSSPEMDSASGLRSCVWSALCQARGHRPSLASSFPALGFVLFQVCGHRNVNRCRASIVVSPRSITSP